MGHTRWWAAAVVALTLTSLPGCGSDDSPPPATKRSDGLLRTQDLDTLRSKESTPGRSEDSSPSMRCTGAEDTALEKAGWTKKSRGYANAEDHWAASTTLWHHDDGDSKAAIAAVRKAIGACRTAGDKVAEGGYRPGWYYYEATGRTGDTEGWRGYTSAGDDLVTEVTLVGLDGHEPPPVFGDLLENSTRRAETVEK